MTKEVEKMYQMMPASIIETNLLSKNSKKVLAALLYSYAICKEARKNKVLIIPNSRLRSAAGIKMNSILPAIRELELYDLVISKRGEKRTHDKVANASKYYIQFENIKKPLIQRTFDDIFGGIENVGYCNYNCNYNCNENLNENLNDNVNYNDSFNYNKKENINKKISINNVSSNSTTMKKEKTSKKKKLEETISGMFGDTTLLEEYEPTIVSSVFTEEDREKLQTIDRKIKKLLKNNNGNSSWEFQVLEDVSDLTDTLLHDKTSLDNYCDTLRDYSYQLYKEKTFSQLKDNVEELVDEVLDALTVQVL